MSTSNKKVIDVICIGDSAIDLTMQVGGESVSQGPSQQICFIHGTKIPVETFSSNVAGNACNVAVGLTKLGLYTNIYTELGADSYGDRTVETLKSFGVDTSLCKRNAGENTNVHTVILYNGERTIFSYHEKRKYILPDMPKSKWIFYSSLAKGFESFQKTLVDYIKSNSDVGLVFNPGTMQLGSGVPALKDVLAVTDVLVVNKEEAELLVSGTVKGLSKNLHVELQKLGPKLTVVTDGVNGSTAYDGMSYEVQGIYKSKQKFMDKTGAGDAFTSGLIAALSYGKSLKEAMKWGTVNAGSKLASMGSINGLLSQTDVEELIKSL